MGRKDKLKFDSRFEGLEKDPVFVRKRKATLACFIIRMFLLGAEYAIILPSIWLYLKTFGVKPWFLGLVVGVYPAAALFSPPVVGYVFDKTKRTKEIILVLNAFEIAGNIVYALPFSHWLVFFGRMLAGFGDGFYACANAEITFTFPQTKRTGMLAFIELGRVLGLTVGPALNFFLSKVYFYIGEWRVDYGTSPGLFMALLWILAEVLTVFYTSDLSKLVEERARYYPNFKLDTRVAPPKEYEIDFKRVRETSLCESVLDVQYGDEEPLINKKKKNGRHFRFYQSVNGKLLVDDEIPEDDEEYFQTESSFNTSESDDSIEIETNESYLRQIYQLLSAEILVIFYADLILWLVQTEFEVFLPLMTQEEYGWTETQVSIVYIVGSIWLMFEFFLMYKFSEKSKIKDHHYINVSLVLNIIAILLFMCEQIPDENDLHSREAIFMTICLCVYSSIPLNLVAAKALIGKLVPREKVGITQGLYGSVGRVTLVVGPIIAGTAFNHRMIFSIVMLLLCLIALIIMVLYLRRIKKKILHMQENDI